MENTCQSDLKTQEMTLSGVPLNPVPSVTLFPGSAPE